MREAPPSRRDCRAAAASPPHGHAPYLHPIHAASPRLWQTHVPLAAPRRRFTVVPIKKAWHRVRPARMAFIDGVEGENTVMHMSNNLPDIRIAAEKDLLEESLLSFGRVITLNTVQTKKGWMYASSGVVLFLLVQLFRIAKQVLKQRRHLRALDDLTKKGS